MNFQITCQPVSRLRIVHAVFSMRFFLRQEPEREDIDCDDRTQAPIVLPFRKARKIKPRPIIQRPALHVVVIYDLHFDIDELPRIELAGNIQARKLLLFALRNHLRRDKSKVFDLVPQ